MSRSRSTRRVELVELMRRPGPLSYVVEPQNRAQRRQLKRLQASAQRTASKGVK
ncbi:MAG: hypothetical protein IV093_03555 [Rubrivivax sp.]|nr:hypothetical protein [Rubrivivax sp.]